MGRDLRQNQGEGIVRARLDGTEEVGERIALVAFARRPLAARKPAMADAAFLANARFVLEKQADLLACVCIANRLQALTEPP